MLNRCRRTLRAGATVVLVLAAVVGIQPALVDGAGSQDAAPTRILFIRGARDTVSADGIENNQLSDITDLVTDPKAGKGYGVFVRQLLDNGYEVAQLEEGGTRQQATPVDLTKANLSQYRAVVLGSNNAAYPANQVKALTDYVAAGGGVLFMADRNWGPVTGRASTSDDLFLANWGITEQQDNGEVETHTRADFTVPSHPTVAGVTSFSSFGVSACTVGPVPAGSGLTAAPIIVIPFTTTVQVNDLTKPDTEGAKRPPSSADGALVVAEPGKGRVACFYDRDPFFNFTINDPAHTQGVLGLDLVNWVSRRS